MADAHTHSQLGPYVLGTLSADERIEFERHLGSCSSCAAELPSLRRVGTTLERAIAPIAPPSSLEQRVLAAVRGDEGRSGSGSDEELGLRIASTRDRVGARGGAAVAAAGLVAALVFWGGGGNGVLELETVMQAPVGAAQASLEVRKTGIGRVVTFRSDTLPVLPKGEYYEIWFVGPGDRPTRPNRISAGTFHPDEDGRSYVTFAAAVDPALYPVVSVTAEPGDGDPRATGPEVLRDPAMTNGIKICGGSGTDRPSFGGLRTVTQPTFVVMAIATRDSRWARANAVPPTTFPLWATKRPSGESATSKPSP